MRAVSGFVMTDGDWKFAIYRWLSSRMQGVSSSLWCTNSTINFGQFSDSLFIFVSADLKTGEVHSSEEHWMLKSSQWAYKLVAWQMQLLSWQNRGWNTHSWIAKCSGLSCTSRESVEDCSGVAQKRVSIFWHQIALVVAHICWSWNSSLQHRCLHLCHHLLATQLPSLLRWGSATLGLPKFCSVSLCWTAVSYSPECGRPHAPLHFSLALKEVIELLQLESESWSSVDLENCSCKAGVYTCITYCWLLSSPARLGELWPKAIRHNFMLDYCASTRSPQIPNLW